MQYLPFLATTKVLMAAVRRGGTRAGARGHPRARHGGGAGVARCGGNDLAERLAADDRLRLDRAAIDAVLADRAGFVGTALHQVDAFGQVEAIVADHPEAARYRPEPIPDRRRAASKPSHLGGSAVTSARALGLPHVHSGKVARLRRRRRPTADGDERSHLGVRRRHGRADPHKGRVLTAMSAFWFAERLDARPPRLHGARRPATLGAGGGGGGGPGGAGDADDQGADAPGGVHRPRLHHRVGVEGVLANGTMHGTRLPADLQESERLQGRCSRRRRRPRGYDENISFSAAAGLLGEAWPPRCAPSRSSCTARAPTQRERASSSRTRSSRWASSRATSCCATRC